MSASQQVPAASLAEGLASASTIPLSSCLPDVLWPPIPGSYAARLLTQLLFLEKSQWLSEEALEARQLKQLASLANHSFRHVPYYAERLERAGFRPGGTFKREMLEQLAPLTRRELQTVGDAIFASELPVGHGKPTTRMTTGSTGAPVTVRGTDVTDFFWRALTIRDHLWHRRDFSQPLAAIRFTRDPEAAAPSGARRSDWGPATRGVVPTGPGALLSIASSVDEQVAWLRHIDPAYVMAYPSALAAVVDVLGEGRVPLPGLRQVRTFGEVVEPQLRESVRHVLGVPLIDTYSSQEVGYLALQCPDHEHYHVQAERLLVEVLDEEGRPCEAGQVGRVVVTDLHNFASPLLRYEIGDYAKLGGPCDCGRGLPVLTQILGRERNMLQLPDGERRWPSFGQGVRPEDLPPFFQVQLVQRSLEEIEVLVVRPDPLTAEEQQQATRYLQQTLDHPFRFDFRHVDEIARGPGGKFEDFVCRIPREGGQAA